MLCGCEPGISSAEDVVALAKEAGLNEKALEADLTASAGVATKLAVACRSVTRHTNTTELSLNEFT